MAQVEAESPSPLWLPAADLQRLIDALRERGHEVWAQSVQDALSSWGPLERVSELARGWRDHQAPGRYRLEPGAPERCFELVHGHEGAKRHAFAPREPLLQIQTEGLGRDFRAEPVESGAAPLALLGVRPCDVSALAIQDRVFLGDRFPDPAYAARRRELFLIEVACTRPGGTCFCTSFGTGPGPSGPFDLCLTELEAGFVVRTRSGAGRALVDALALAEAPAEQLEREARDLAACAEAMPRAVDAGGLPERLPERPNHPRWDDVAERCLGCTNCTQVCPTCFCHDIRDEPSLDGTHTLRVREWGSCFDPGYARIHGLDVRSRVRERYRQWLLHKLATWTRQFGTPGCVGCGRCITWCPAGIDLTEEAAALCEEPS
ncbi:MAG: 4Fe-4S dicluster domain-containing protein [Myxococcota bacterium]|nr:4Fe-4S dicluster domain-containing protein [Myxococcota bacterium]